MYLALILTAALDIIVMIKRYKGGSARIGSAHARNNRGCMIYIRQ